MALIGFAIFTGSIYNFAVAVEFIIIKKDIKTGEIVGFEKFNLLPVKDGEEIPEVKFVVREKV